MQFAYKQLGAVDMLADVYPGFGDGPRPVVLMLHAGGLIAGGRKWFPRYLVHALQAAGYTAVAIDHRLAPETRGDVIFEDVVDAVAWIRRALPTLVEIDGHRMAILGQSAGGYLALRCGHALEPRPQACVTFYGYGDIIGDWLRKPDGYYSTFTTIPEDAARKAVADEPMWDASDRLGRMKFYFFCRQQGLWLDEVFGTPTSSARLASYCPSRQVDERYPPTLLLHGDADTDVPCDRSAAMAEALRVGGVEHELLVLSGADHSFDVPGSPRPRPGWLFNLAAAAAPWMPARLLPGRPPRGSDRYMKPMLAFLAAHLGQGVQGQ